jgi:hypothetical protein
VQEKGGFYSSREEWNDSSFRFMNIPAVRTRAVQPRVTQCIPVSADKGPGVLAVRPFYSESFRISDQNEVISECRKTDVCRPEKVFE